MALNVVQYEEIVVLLGQVPGIVDLLEGGHSSFSEEVHAWLKRAEATLQSNRVPTVSRIAAYRAMLIQANRGVHHKEINFIRRPTIRKVQEATACMVLERSNDLLHDAIAERQVVFQEAERISRQVIAVSEAKGLLRMSADGRPHQEFLTHLQNEVALDPDLASVYVHLLALVGKTDVLIFFDRAIVGMC